VFFFRAIKKMILWDYRRGSWQHEFLCLAYIAALIFIPTNSNGWFADGERVHLGDDQTIMLHRVDTNLFLTWDPDDGEPGIDNPELLRFVTGRFGPDAKLIRDAEEGARRYLIVPRGLQ